MKIPVVKTDRIFHIGSMDPADRLRGAGMNGTSHEGHALSWSPCPSAWQRIAKLGGKPLQLFSKPGGFFFDVDYAVGDRDFRASCLDWGRDNGYGETSGVFTLWSLDAETEEWNFSLFQKAEDAAFEAGFAVSELPNDRKSKKAKEIGYALLKSPGVVFKASAALVEKTGMCRPHPTQIVDATEAVAILYAQDTIAKMGAGLTLDGFYYADAYAPENLSAPRGGLFQDCIDAWHRREVDWRLAPDADGEFDARWIPEFDEIDVEQAQEHQVRRRF